MKLKLAKQDSQDLKLTKQDLLIAAIAVENGNYAGDAVNALMYQNLVDNADLVESLSNLCLAYKLLPWDEIEIKNKPLVAAGFRLAALEMDGK